jgi:hypothetical protein
MALILVSSRQHGSASVPSTGVGTTVGGPVEFEHGNDEYRHRMQVNLLAAVLLIVLVGAGM